MSWKNKKQNETKTPNTKTAGFTHQCVKAHSFHFITLSIKRTESHQCLCTSVPGNLCQRCWVTFLSHAHVIGPVFSRSRFSEQTFLDLWVKCLTDMEIKTNSTWMFWDAISKLISWIRVGLLEMNAFSKLATICRKGWRTFSASNARKAARSSQNLF